MYWLLLQVYIYLNLDKTSTNSLATNVCLEFLKYWYFTYSLARHVLTTSLVMYVLNYYKTKVYVYLNLDKTSNNNLASNVCLEFLKNWYFTYSLTRHVLTTSLVMYVLNYYKTKVYVYLNLDKTSTNTSLLMYVLIFKELIFYI
jgi:predicted hydrolase (HD superfamily)